MNPSRHSHWYELIKSWQCPSFWQGEESHSFISTEQLCPVSKEGTNTERLGPSYYHYFFLFRKHHGTHQWILADTCRWNPLRPRSWSQTDWTQAPPRSCERPNAGNISHRSRKGAPCTRLYPPGSFLPRSLHKHKDTLVFKGSGGCCCYCY